MNPHSRLRLPPELLAMDNAMEAFMEEHRRKNIHVAPPPEPQPKLSLWARAHMKLMGRKS